MEKGNGGSGPPRIHHNERGKDIRDKVRALELYAQQARNFEAEKRAASIRIRAELKTGELLRAQEKAKGGDRGGRKPKDPRTARASNTGSKTLKDLGISHDQSSRWQTLAENPKAVEKYLREEEDVPTTTGALAAARPVKKPEVGSYTASDPPAKSCAVRDLKGARGFTGGGKGTCPTTTIQD
jgi:hypothetical protein